MPKTAIDELPTELIALARRLDLLARSYLAAVSFIAQDTARDVRYWDNHLLSYLVHDFIQAGHDRVGQWNGTDVERDPRLGGCGWRRLAIHRAPASRCRTRSPRA